MTEVCLVATTLNEADAVDEWWLGVERQTLRPGRVVVVDGGSTDSTLSQLQAIGKRESWLTVISAPGANISAGRNLAIAQLAPDAIVAVTDLGTVADSDWLEHLVRPLLAGEADVASGFFRPGGSTPLEMIIASCTIPTLKEIDPEQFLPSSRSVAFLRSAWAGVGGYPEHLEVCEDLVFDLAMREQGAQFRFVPEAQVVWRARPTLRAFFRQYRRYAKGDAAAHLFGRRHLARYSAYAGGAAAAVSSGRRNSRGVLVFAAGFGCLYLARSFARVWGHACLAPPAMRVLGSVLAPAVVLTGDVAKMLGYIEGQLSRWR